MRLIVACAAAAQLVSGAVDIKSVKHVSTAQIVPNSFLVELSPGTHLKRGFTSPHEELYHDLQRRGAKWKVTKEYAEDLLTGAAVTLDSDADLLKLAQASGVQSITPVYLHPPPKPVYQETLEATVDATAPKDVFSTHRMTGVDKLHNEGYYGKGIKIGIIDSGVDYMHPALGGGFGPGKKVIGGYDFVGDNYTGRSGTPPPAPDNDPREQCNGHGTHVAGTIGANPNNPWNISGVAYEAEINAYRVFGCDGSVPDDILIDSLLRAYKDGNDVITLSLGGPDGWTEAVSGVVASRIAEKGRIVTIAAGNDGQYGSWYASGPGTGRSVISVGSVDNTALNLQNATVSNGRQVSYQSLEKLAIPDGLPIYATSQDPTTATDACDPLPANTPDLSNYVVLIRRGTCTFVQKVTNAAAKGGRYFLIYDNKDQSLGAISTGEYPGALITQADGLFLLQEAIPRNYTISFPNAPFNGANPSGGLMSSFSTYGPSHDMYLKPAVSAPGGSILSTIPLALGSWGIKSGTSMATPFAAGSYALLLQVRGKNTETAKKARTYFQNTAIPVNEAATNTSLIETASHQGAGLINVYDAIKNTGSLTPSELLLNDTANFKGLHTLLVKNDGKKPVTYTFTHVPAGTANTINGIQAIIGPVPLSGSVATVSIVPDKVVVPAGWSLPVLVSIKPPAGLDATKFPVYSGYIKATGSDSTTLQSTYIGVAAKLKDAKIIDNTDAYFGVKTPVVTDSEGNPVPPVGSATYTLNGTDTPLVLYRLVQGSPLVRFDLIDSKTNVTTNQRRSSEFELAERSDIPASPHSTLSKRSIWDWLFPNKGQTSGGTFAAVKTLGVLYQEDYVPRNSAAATADANGYTGLQVGTFANGTAIPDGSYKVLFRALKITGNPKKQEDYEVWTSPTIVVKRA
ncbi:Minor extracellular protease vpr [Rhizoctonia solani]|uniref:Minor extracellular protease vpr n=1 Tax=Rhizoctonia solani TaxID=456999 RepID=A0A0K6GDA0_9AGAM|nr:Minor extracellular protease vpr [Rhizoctonia solani]